MHALSHHASNCGFCIANARGEENGGKNHFVLRFSSPSSVAVVMEVRDLISSLLWQRPLFGCLGKAVHSLALTFTVTQRAKDLFASNEHSCNSTVFP